MRATLVKGLPAALAVSIAMAATACSPIQVVTSPLVAGSQWQVVSVDDESTVGLELILTFIGTSATLSSRCGASSGEVVVEARGHDVAFGPLQGPAGQPACPAEALALHRRVAAALQGIERWESVGDGTELHGASTIRLRSQATDT